MKSLMLVINFLLICTIAQAQEKTIDKTFRNIKAVRLTAASGDIELKKSPGQEVKVLIKYTYNDEEYKVTLEQNGSDLTIKEKFSTGRATGNSKWTLEIPDDIKITVNTGSGDVRVTGVTLQADVNSGSGDIELARVNGDLRFNTGSGDVKLTNVDGTIRMITGSGNIVAAAGNGTYKLTTGSGDIRIEQLKGGFNLNTGSGDVNAKNLTFTGRSSFNTGSGDANVTLNAPLDHNIGITSGSGNAVLNFNGNTIDGEITMTANKRNGKIVAPFKFDREETEEEGYSTRIRKTAKIGSKSIEIKISTGSGTAEIIK